MSSSEAWPLRRSIPFQPPSWISRPSEGPQARRCWSWRNPREAPGKPRGAWLVGWFHRKRWEKDGKQMGTHGISPWFSSSFKMFNHQTCLKITGYESYMSRRLMISSGIHCGLLQVDKSRTGVLVGFTKANFVQICYIGVYCIIQVKWVYVYLQYIYIYTMYRRTHTVYTVNVVHRVYTVASKGTCNLALWKPAFLIGWYWELPGTTPCDRIMSGNLSTVILVGGLEPFFYFCIYWEYIIIPIDEIFFRGF